MMSNSTLPLDFFHSDIELVTCGQLLLYFDISLPVKLLFISSACGCDKVDQLHNLTTDLHLIIRVHPTNAYPSPFCQGKSRKFTLYS